MSQEPAGLHWRPHPRVRGWSSFRHGAGDSAPPFDHLNLGLSSGDEADVVLANRRGLQDALGLGSAPRWLRQVHGTCVAIEPGEDMAEADAAVTRAPGTVLAILTADCLPVLLAATDASEVAAAHAGWRGLAGGVLEATIAAMQTPPLQLQAWLGPAAGPARYEVGSEVREAFVGPDPETSVHFVATRPGHWLVDLFALARWRLARAGVLSVQGGGVCTISDPQRFYSHRRDGRTGRMATLIWIAEGGDPDTERAPPQGG